MMFTINYYDVYYYQYCCCYCLSSEYDRRPLPEKRFLALSEVSQRIPSVKVYRESLEGDAQGNAEEQKYGAQLLTMQNIAGPCHLEPETQDRMLRILG